MTKVVGGIDMPQYYNSILHQRNKILGEIAFRTLQDIKKAPDPKAYAEKVKAGVSGALDRFDAEVARLLREARAKELADIDRMAQNEMIRRGRK